MTGVVTQGGGPSGGFVTEFAVQWSEDGIRWRPIEAVGGDFAKVGGKEASTSAEVGLQFCMRCCLHHDW